MQSLHLSGHPTPIYNKLSDQTSNNLRQQGQGNDPCIIGVCDIKVHVWHNINMPVLCNKDHFTSHQMSDYLQLSFLLSLPRTKEHIN